MSYLTNNNNILVRYLYLWVCTLGNKETPDVRAAELQKWQIVPHTLDKMLEWVHVMQDEDCVDSTRGYQLVYSLPSPEVEGEVYPMSIRLHGFIKMLQLATLGNWNGVQPDFLAAPDNPNHYYERISAEWNTNDKLPVAKYNATNQLTAIKHLLLSPGDFVEVGVEFDIVVRRGASGQKTVKVFPTFTHIIQLQESVAAKSSSDQPKKCSSHDATMSVKCTKVRQTLDIATHSPSGETDIKNTDDDNTNVPSPTDVSLPALNHARPLDKGKSIDRNHKKPSQTLLATTSTMPAADVSKTRDKSHQLLQQLPKTKMLASQPKHSPKKVAIRASSIGAAMPQPILNTIDISEIAHYTEDFQT
ncbi:hypothetical protein SERLA73DRAFT_76143 [Serpula lacrymans var. lacrymans S7.3]|uniref:Uncharacterized protein n=1 Tax=Serpula lacrymans var. lacrymans (strain S7.3) TaxID=936435 RepID=F8Q6B5_SERL3|nr:hypothetical protein SERLA73DRAFT_76143 [Serpula lacrymans var. lacrymans S7.3]